MLLPILIEPSYRNSIWALQTLDGLTEEASRRKYKLRLLDGDKYQEMDYDALFGGGARMVMITGTSLSWMPDALNFFSEKNIASILISYDPTESTVLRGMVRMDYVNATHTLINYLEECGREKIALYGYNPNSSADSIKLRCFESWRKKKPRADGQSVFNNYASLSDCYNEFYKNIQGFDAVICANDIVAVSLLRRLKADRVAVPEALYITSFGDSILAQRASPPITSISLDHREMGRQAVTLYAYLYRQNATTNVSVRVRSQLQIRESTGRMPFTHSSVHWVEDDYVKDVDFYSDKETRSLLNAERMFTACDEADEALLQCILRGESMDQLESRFYLTTSALHYRKKRLMNLTGCATTRELSDFLKFLNKANLF